MAEKNEEKVKKAEKVEKTEKKTTKATETKKATTAKTTTKSATKPAEKKTVKTEKVEKAEKVEKKETKKDSAATKTKKVAEKKIETSEVKEAKAILKYERISSRKIKIVADLMRGKDIDEALAIVKFAPKSGAAILEKVLKSAIANAENNHGMEHSKLYVAEVYANQGPTLKRIRPAAKGSAVRIRKRTSHITVVLREHE